MIFMYNSCAGVVGAFKFQLEETGLMANFMQHGVFLSAHVLPSL